MITVDVYCSECEESLEFSAEIDTDFVKLIRDHDKICSENDSDNEEDED